MKYNTIPSKKRIHIDSKHEYKIRVSDECTIQVIKGVGSVSYEIRIMRTGLPTDTLDEVYPNMESAVEECIRYFNHSFKPDMKEVAEAIFNFILSAVSGKEEGFIEGMIVHYADIRERLPFRMSIIKKAIGILKEAGLIKVTEAYDMDGFNGQGQLRGRGFASTTEGYWLYVGRSEKKFSDYLNSLEEAKK